MRSWQQMPAPSAESRQWSVNAGGHYRVFVSNTPRSAFSSVVLAMPVVKAYCGLRLIFAFESSVDLTNDLLNLEGVGSVGMIEQIVF